MTARVIQGFFPGGMHRLGGSGAMQPMTSPGGSPAPRPAPGRPPLVHGSAVRTTGAIQRFGGDGSFAIDPAQVGLVRSGGKPLPQALLAKMEAAFGADFSGVRVHVGPQASRIGALAFTTGSDLYFAPGQYQPESVKGQQLIGHELAHVIQQRQGRVRAPGSGVAVVQDRMLEAEADRLGMRAAGESTSTGGSHRHVMQRKTLFGFASDVPKSARYRDVIQRFTHLNYNNPAGRPGTDTIANVQHNRTLHTDTHRKLAAYYSGYRSVNAAQTDGCNDCNHYVAYNTISTAVRQLITGSANLDGAVNALMAMNGNMPGGFSKKRTRAANSFGFRIEGPPNVNIVPIAAAAGGAPNIYNEATINTEVDDLILNLANNPRNLYYWPASSGAVLDVPQGAAPGSTINVGTLVTRLASYRTELLNLGLAV